MRESIGGTMLFWIVLFFLSVFITFMASIIKYARVYKVKNNLINYIERQEGLNDLSEVSAQLESYGYKHEYFQVCRYNPSEVGAYYSVQLCSSFEVPIVGWKYCLHISGETRTITTGTKFNNSFQGSSDCP